jgi:hypothetical protein
MRKHKKNWSIEKVNWKVWRVKEIIGFGTLLDMQLDEIAADRIRDGSMVSSGVSRGILFHPS